MARVHHITRANKPTECGKCGKTIEKGEPYSYAQPGFRNARKKIRCGDPKCRFRQSDLTTSKMSVVYAAQESVEDALAAWSGEDDTTALTEALESAASDVREVADEYQEAADAMNAAGEELREKADNLASWADTLESVEFDDRPEVAGDEPTEDEKEAIEAWESDCKEKVEDALGELPE